MNLFIKNIKDDDIINVNIPKTNTILDLKTLILSKINSSKELDEILLVFAGRLLENSKTLKQSGINNGSTLSLVFKLQPYHIETHPSVNRPRRLFTIITTGILNWGTSTDEENLIHLWTRNRVLSNLIQYIPDHFQIEVIHLDPLFNLDDKMTPLSPELKTNVKNLIENDLHLERVYQSSFSQESFSPHTGIVPFIGNDLINNPYLVFDFAHLFSFTQTPGLVIFRPYHQRVMMPVIRVSPWNDFGRRVMRNEKLLEVDREGVLTTFIDKLIMDGVSIDEIEPINGLEISSGYDLELSRIKLNYEDSLIKEGYELGSVEMNQLVVNYLNSSRIREIKQKRMNEIFNDIWEG